MFLIYLFVFLCFVALIASNVLGYLGVSLLEIDNAVDQTRFSVYRIPAVTDKLIESIKYRYDNGYEFPKIWLGNDVSDGFALKPKEFFNNFDEVSSQFDIILPTTNIHDFTEDQHETFQKIAKRARIISNYI